MTDNNETTENKKLDLASVVDHKETVDLFDIIIRRDTNFLKEGSEEFNGDEDFAHFCILCQNYVLADTQGMSQLITINVEAAEDYLNKTIEHMQGALYCNIVTYNADGTVKDTKIVKIHLLGAYPLNTSEDLVIRRMFIFAVDSTFK